MLNSDRPPGPCFMITVLFHYFRGLVLENHARTGDIRQTFFEEDPALSWCLQCSGHLWKLIPGITAITHLLIQHDAADQASDSGAAEATKVQNLLKLTIALWGTLNKNKRPSGVSDKEGFASAIVAQICELQHRLEGVLDTEGKRFMMSVLDSCIAGKQTRDDLLSMKESFEEATPVLKACFRTVCSASEIANDQEAFSLDADASFLSLVDVMPRYAKVSSLNGTVVQMMPQAAQDKCKQIQAAVHDKLNTR